jgi:hypothetical protein
MSCSTSISQPIVSEPALPCSTASSIKQCHFTSFLHQFDKIEQKLATSSENCPYRVKPRSPHPSHICAFTARTLSGNKQTSVPSHMYINGPQPPFVDMRVFCSTIITSAKRSLYYKTILHNLSTIIRLID